MTVEPVEPVESVEPVERTCGGRQIKFSRKCLESEEMSKKAASQNEDGCDSTSFERAAKEGTNGPGRRLLVLNLRLSDM